MLWNAITIEKLRDTAFRHGAASTNACEALDTVFQCLHRILATIPGRGKRDHTQDADPSFQRKHQQGDSIECTRVWGPK